VAVLTRKMVQKAEMPDAKNINVPFAPWQRKE
jgi:hypothetical protein